MVKFGERLKAARTAKHMSQQALADVIGKSLNTVGLYERGLRQPSLETLCLLADTLEVSSDYLLARNMELGMRSGQYDLVSYVIASIATLCEGELLQSDRAERMEITRDAYLEIIYKKTASLLGISAGVGALSAGANREQVARMRRFGDALGMAFQIQDDILDFTRGAETGKPSNNDLREHKITLPLLLLLDRADAARRDELLALLARCREDEAAVDALQQAVEEQGGLQEASKVMQSYLQRATALLAEWPDGPIRSALVNLCAYVAERNR